MTRRERISNRAVEIIKQHQKGIRYSELIAQLHGEMPEIPMNTLHGTVWNLDQRRKGEVYKPVRGLWRHSSFREQNPSGDERASVTAIAKKIKEEEFYEPFSDWIQNELEECTKSISLGGNKFRDKWGTPDVIGLREPRPSDIIKLPTEIVSAEIKLDTNGLITAFGQCCSYKLFSHKFYLVVPNNSSEEDKTRLDALCRIFGIGLIFFDSSNPKEPKFEIRVRATKQEPDMFFVNKYLKLIEDELF